MKKYFSILVLFYSSICFPQTKIVTPIPENSKQMILVVTDSVESTSGNLIYFERQNSESSWDKKNESIPVVIGRSGLGWGRGLNPIDSSKIPLKKEGDGRSPAGVFALGSAFGYAESEEMAGLKIPYIHVTKPCECVDDVHSAHYNQVVFKDEVKNVDWNSSEKMFFVGVWYEQGIIVKQNNDPVIDGAGSCIFLHNWAEPNETTAGCTAMKPSNLKKIIWWLDSSSNPVLVQLTKKLYDDYKQLWQLPNLNEKIIQ